jgi:three-Cys-motif partner protein
MSHEFGGDWTQQKLELIRKYLVAYAQIMKDRNYRFAYIDAFAGTGYRTLKQDDNPNALMFPLLAEAEPQQFLDGSARIALRVQPRFNKYIFIEKDEKRFAELQISLKTDFPELWPDIMVIHADANDFITKICLKSNWSLHRAVLFLDPYGMQVNWATIKAIASTKAIDLWYLFPLGIAVNRLLKRDGNINEVLQERLNRIFGESDWYAQFYEQETTLSLFGEETQTKKVANFAAIEKYVVSRLGSVFTEVAKNPLTLRNSTNNPLYLLCFASANKTAKKIAEDILRKERSS